MKRRIYIATLWLAALLSVSCEEILLEEDISNRTVRLIAPVEGTEFYSTSITFNWELVEDATEYRIQIAKPDFNNTMQIVADNIIETNSFTTQLNIGEYEWRVQALNSGYETAYTTRSLTIVSNDAFQDNSVALTTPEDNLITNNASQNLIWQSVIGATNYDVQIVESTSSTILYEEQVSNTFLNYTFPEGNFEWRVRATNGSENTLYSSRSIVVDITAPNTPTLNFPEDESSSSESEVTFNWSRTPIDGSTEQDSIFIYSDEQLTNLVYEGIETSPYTTTTLSDGTYYWYVESFDEAGNISQQSTVYSFTLN